MQRRLVILTQGYARSLKAKTAVSLLRYRPEHVVAILDEQEAGGTAQAVFGVGGDIPIVGSLDQATAADTLLIGIATAGGVLPSPMRTIILDAIRRGMNIESGLHAFLCDDNEISQAARAAGVTLNDVRKNNEYDVAQRKDINNTCLRLQTVGNDCSVGKMVVAIELADALRNAGQDAQFVATGQTGIMIEGSGIPIDCVVADFINGAAEKLVLQNQHHEIMVIEGQASLVQPRYSSVTLGLLHGCVPHGLIMCYEVGRKQVYGMDCLTIPPLKDIIGLYERAAAPGYPCKVIGIAMNSKNITDPAEVEDERQRLRDEFGLPVCDVIRHGPDDLVQAVNELQAQRRSGAELK
jgi:D-glutamate N-acetyltransferase